LGEVHWAVDSTYEQLPFLAHGYDRLAFGHFIIAVPFIMAIRDPLRNTWVVSFGVAACLSVLPFAAIFGAIRAIPVFWRGFDSLFGIGGLVILVSLRRLLIALARHFPSDPPHASGQSVSPS
jgi:hypothetical protein